MTFHIWKLAVEGGTDVIRGSYKWTLLQAYRIMVHGREHKNNLFDPKKNLSKKKSCGTLNKNCGKLKSAATFFRSLKKLKTCGTDVKSPGKKKHKRGHFKKESCSGIDVHFDSHRFMKNTFWNSYQHPMICNKQTGDRSIDLINRLQHMRHELPVGAYKRVEQCRSSSRTHPILVPTPTFTVQERGRVAAL
jgi:hypothetical protein